MVKNRVLAVVMFLVLVCVWNSALAHGKVKATIYSDYFESNQSGLQGDSSYLVFDNKEAFNAVLYLTPPMDGSKPRVAVPDQAFDTGVVFAVIKRGPAPTTYSLKKLEMGAHGTLKVIYTTKSSMPGTASFSSPLIVSVANKDVKTILFVENGKTVQTLKTKRF